MSGRLGIDDVAPTVSCGRYPAKAVSGEHVPVSATVWREGHAAVGATVVWKGPADRLPRQVRMTETGEDHFTAAIAPDACGMWTFRVDAWSDPWSTWRHAVEAKVGAGQGVADLGNDLETGARLLGRVSRRPERRRDRELLAAASGALQDPHRALPERLAPALSEPVARIMHSYPVRELRTKGRTHQLWVDRPLALRGSWYEFFPRSTGGWDEAGRPVHGTFATAAKELERVATMGFDVAYLPPIHPIGRINRKGPNNALVADSHDVGSPWAIGSAEGGHDAVHPALGTIEDFDAFVVRAGELGLEVALDLALQCAPDHPWVTSNPK
ncbi:MAG: maltotransferase domain-containing protein, partial [Sciscionella sp.]